MSDLPWTIVADGILLSVRLTPKGGRDQIEGIQKLSDGRMVLKARVRAIPEDGEANAALQKLIAKNIGVPASRISLQSGQTARIKMLKIEGDGAALAAMIAAVSSQ